MSEMVLERPTATIAGPRGNPVLGMAAALRRDVLGTLLDNFRRYGDMVAYPVGPARGPSWMRGQAVALHHPRDIQLVFTQTEVFSRQTSSYRVLRELFGNNLVTSDGDAWVTQKRTLQPLFTRRSVEEYGSVIEREAQRVLERQGIGSGTLDVARAMELYALRVLGYTLFKDDEGVDDRTVDALERLVPVVGRQVRSRATRFLRVPLRLPTPSNRRFLTTRTELYATIDRFLARHGQAHSSVGGPDLLSQLHEAGSPQAPVFTGQDIRDQALIFLLSGHTTTSNALTSTLYLLASNPEVQEEVAEAAAASDGSDHEHDLVRASVQEGMRLFPPSYVIGRRLAVDTEVDGRALTAGTNILVSPWVTHRHPGFWAEPERYDPHRFVGESDRPRYAYFPFGGGARECIGRHFALLEATILVRTLLQAFRIEAIDAEVELSQLISLRPAGPVRVRCHPR